jgi:probable rRNA maturation factor
MADDDQPPLIALDDRQSDAVDLESLLTLARATLLGEGIADAEEIAELHRRYLRKEGPTDVLSFPLDEEAGEDGVRMLGDVVIAPAVAARNNPEDPGSELRLLLVHGILHLLGHDHTKRADRENMWARQERYSGVRVE